MTPEQVAWLEEVRKTLADDLGLDEETQTKMVFGRKVRMKKIAGAPGAARKERRREQKRQDRRKIGGKSLSKWKAKLGHSL